MKVIIQIILFLLVSSSVFCQQYLWSTVQHDSLSEKYIPIEHVNNEIIKFYDHYELHYDLSGFSKERFIEEITFGFEDWQILNEINDLTVCAIKSNTGTGSVVLVLFISDKNINLLIFTNEIIGTNLNYLFNYKAEKEKFEAWLETLKN